MKIFKRDRIAAAALLLVMGCIALTGAAPCRAAQSVAASIGMPVFGSIDLNKIDAGFTKKAAIFAPIQDLNEKLAAQIKQLQVNDMLTREQLQQYTTLLAKATPTDQDRAAMAALQAQSARDAQELTSLQQKPNPTDTEKARLTALTTQQQASRQALQDIADQFNDQSKAVQDKVGAQYLEAIRAGVAAVAKEKGITVVFTSQTAFYAANDITDDVLKHLNK